MSIKHTQALKRNWKKVPKEERSERMRSLGLISAEKHGQSKVELMVEAKKKKAKKRKIKSNVA